MNAIVRETKRRHSMKGFSLIEVPDGSAVILSIAKYYSPSGKAIQDNAITPNVVVADVDDAAGDGASPDDEDGATPANDQDVKPKNTVDDQLNKALEVLKNRESKG